MQAVFGMNKFFFFFATRKGLRRRQPKQTQESNTATPNSKKNVTELVK